MSKGPCGYSLYIWATHNVLIGELMDSCPPLVHYLNYEAKRSKIVERRASLTKQT